MIGGSMAQRSKETQQIRQEILDNRRAIQHYEVQMNGVRTLIARYGYDNGSESFCSIA